MLITLKEILFYVVGKIPWELYMFTFLIPIIFLKKQTYKKFLIYLFVVSSFSINIFRINDDNPFKPSFNFSNINEDKTFNYIYSHNQQYFLEKALFAFSEDKQNFNQKLILEIYKETDRDWPPVEYLYSINNLAAYLHQQDDCSDFQKSRIYINISDEVYEYSLCLN